MTNIYLSQHLPGELPRDPMHWAFAWLQHATRQAVQRNPNAMTLSTVDAAAKPSSRVVLCKSFVADPGYVVLYTNYRSRKAADIETNPAVAIMFHWDALGRQVRIEGPAVRSPQNESDAYFASRYWGSQLGAWASDQSQAINSRAALMRQLRDRARDLGVSVSDDLQSLTEDTQPTIPRPEHWGGYRVWAEAVELWIEGADRIHERARWTRKLRQESDHSFNGDTWRGERLQP